MAVSDDDKLVERAIAFLDANRPEQALELTRAYLSRHPDDAHALTVHASALRLTGEFEAAREAAEQSINLNPNDPFAYQILANALGDLSRFAEARSAAEKGQELAPDAWEAHLARAVVDAEECVYTPEGRKAVEKILELGPDRVESHLIAASFVRPVLFESDRETVRYHAEKILELDPQNAVALALLAGLEFAKKGGMLAGAELTLRAVALEPTSDFVQQFLFMGVYGSLKHVGRIIALVLFVVFLFAASLDAEDFPRYVAVLGATAWLFALFIIRLLLSRLGKRIGAIALLTVRRSLILPVWILAMVSSLLLMLLAPVLAQPAVVVASICTWLVLVGSGFIVALWNLTLRTRT